MSVEHFRTLCHSHMNRPVEIRTLDGNIHRGIITNVDHEHVWLRPLDDGGPGARFDGPGFGGPGLGGPGLGGPGLFFWGFGWGFPVALAGIVGITAISLAALW